MDVCLSVECLPGLLLLLRLEVLLDPKVVVELSTGIWTGLSGAESEFIIKT